MRTLVFGSLALIIAGCATGRAMRGSVVMKVNDSVGYIGLGQGEVEVDDVVRVTHIDCYQGPKRYSCHREIVGDGRVTHLLGTRYAVVEFPETSNFAEGDYVERIKTQAADDPLQ
jgi:hypothetical protein